MGLDVPLPLVHHVFELTVRGTEGVLDRHLHIVVASADARILVDVDVSASGHGQMDANPIGVARIVPIPGLSDYNACRGYVLSN
jgi:hypothetical protein